MGNMKGVSSQTAQPERNFSLGRVVISIAATEKLVPEEIALALSRHARRDWGDVSDSDRQENELSLDNGYRLFSVYHGHDGTKFWIITEADRSVTTVLLPDDY